jgi:citrate synthase
VCHNLLSKTKRRDPLLEIALKLEEVVLKDSYFTDHNLYPNVDFYSGILLRIIGIPLNMFTVMFAIGRLPGWVAQWKESMSDPNWKISRPRQIYIGNRTQPYVPFEQRT